MRRVAPSASSATDNRSANFSELTRATLLLTRLRIVRLITVRFQSNLVVDEVTSPRHWRSHRDSLPRPLPSKLDTYSSNDPKSPVRLSAGDSGWCPTQLTSAAGSVERWTILAGGVDRDRNQRGQIPVSVALLQCNVARSTDAFAGGLYLGRQPESPADRRTRDSESAVARWPNALALGRKPASGQRSEPVRRHFPDVWVL